MRFGQQEPLTFENAPRVEVDGKLYLDEEAAIDLGDRIAAQYSTLLERLAKE